MYALDFMYDNRYLSDFGFIVCDFDSSSGANIVSAGSKISFITSPVKNGRRHVLSGTKYEECITSTFDICKNPDLYEDMEITNEEYIEIMRWLNRKKFLRLCFIDDEHDIEPCYYEATFNISKIMIADILYGIRLEMTTDKPFGYGEEKHINHSFEGADGEVFYLTDTSDEIGEVIPTLKICYQATDGSLQIKNELTQSVVNINYCSTNENITINGLTKQITTDDKSHDIYMDYDYGYLTIGNTAETRKNPITVNKKCTVEIIYSPIMKISPN